MRALAGVALLAALGCSPPPPAATEQAAPRPAPARRADAVSRADQLIADAAKREAEYQQTLKDEKERKAGVAVYNQYIVQGNVLEGPLPQPTPGRSQEWWRESFAELRRRMNHNRGLMDQARKNLDAARAQMQGGQVEAATSRLAVRDAEAEYDRIQKAFYRDSDWAHNMRVKAQEYGLPKEWWIQ